MRGWICSSSNPTAESPQINPLTYSTMKLFYFLALAGSAMALPALDYYQPQVEIGEYDGDDGCEEPITEIPPQPETTVIYEETTPVDPPCYDENGNLIDENELESYEVMDDEINPLDQ